MTPLELNTLGIEMALEGLEIRQLDRASRRFAATALAPLRGRARAGLEQSRSSHDAGDGQ